MQIFDQQIVVSWKPYACIYNGTVTGSQISAFDLYQFCWLWMTVDNPNALKKTSWYKRNHILIYTDFPFCC